MTHHGRPKHPDIEAAERLLRLLPLGFFRALEARILDKRGDVVEIALPRDRAHRVYRVRINSPPTVLEHVSADPAVISLDREQR